MNNFLHLSGIELAKPKVRYWKNSMTDVLCTFPLKKFNIVEYVGKNKHNKTAGMFQYFELLSMYNLCTLFCTVFQKRSPSKNERKPKRFCE
jgi:hypothetical protein